MPRHWVYRAISGWYPDPGQQFAGPCVSGKQTTSIPRGARPVDGSDFSSSPVAREPLTGSSRSQRRLLEYWALHLKECPPRLVAGEIHGGVISSNFVQTGSGRESCARKNRPNTLRISRKISDQGGFPGFSASRPRVSNVDRFRSASRGLKVLLALLISFPWSFGLVALDTQWELSTARQQAPTAPPQSQSCVGKQGRQVKLGTVTDPVLSSLSYDEEERDDSILGLIDCSFHGSSNVGRHISDSYHREPTFLLERLFIPAARLCPLRC